MRFAVADEGIGLRASLTHRGATTDAEATELAVGGVSRVAEPGRGQGFPTMRRITEDSGGRLEVVTGEVHWMRSRVTGLATPYNGTLIQGTIRYAA